MVATLQIDIEKLRAERRENTTFINAQRGAHAIETNLKHAAPRDFELTRDVDPHPFIPKSDDMQASCEEILNIQVAGLVKRLYHINAQKAVIGISGGLDSTLALLVTVKAFDQLNISRKGIIQHFEDIGQNPKIHDITYENSQARERTQILMDVANKENAIVVGTGDLSELALGWATYNGDHMSMYGVNAGVPKTLIRHLVSFVAGEMATRRQKTWWVPTSSTTSSSIISCATASVPRRYSCWHSAPSAHLRS